MQSLNSDSNKLVQIDILVRIFIAKFALRQYLCGTETGHFRAADYCDIFSATLSDRHLSALFSVQTSTRYFKDITSQCFPQVF